MNKPYWSGTGTRGGNTYADPHGDGAHPGDAKYSYRGSSGYDTSDTEAVDYEAYEGYAEGYDEGYPDGEDYADYDEYTDRDHRWRWIAGIAAVVLFVSVVAIATVLGNDSATSTSSTETSAAGEPAQDSAPATSTTPRTVIATVPPSAAPTEPLAPETVVTVTPTPSATHPGPPEPPPSPIEGVAPERTITYSVTGNRQLFDLVTIIYTDEQGFPRTDINVALPWTKTVVLNPGVETQSVTATSVTGQLNCTITDGTGAVTVAQNSNTLITTCTK